MPTFNQRATVNLPTAQLKFGDYILREELEGAVTEPLPKEWADVLRQLERQEKQRDQMQRWRHPRKKAQ